MPTSARQRASKRSAAWAWATNSSIVKVFPATLGVAGQGQIFVAHGQDAAGLNTNDGHALLGIGRKQCHVVIGPGLGLVGLAAGDERTPATLARSGDEDPVIHSSRRHDERPAC